MILLLNPLCKLQRLCKERGWKDIRYTRKSENLFFLRRQINDFFAAFETSSLNYSYIVKQEAQISKCSRDCGTLLYGKKEIPMTVKASKRLCLPLLVMNQRLISHDCMAVKSWNSFQTWTCKKKTWEKSMNKNKRFKGKTKNTEPNWDGEWHLESPIIFYCRIHEASHRHLCQPGPTGLLRSFSLCMESLQPKLLW